ncbi:MAG: FtsX-like permease family protein [Bacteroidaceae bacterium]|nr:FtsX-like permease family protein [Bacteroidaceae bacterium]
MILKNLWAHRRQNGWIFAEIALITILSFYFIDHFTVTTYDRYFCRPAGEFEQEHLVVGQVGQVSGPDSASFATLYALRDQIRALPEVQYVHLAVGFIGDYNMDYMSTYSSEADSSRRCGAREGWFLRNEQYFETQGLTAIEGSPSAEELSNCPEGGAVITRSVARALFGTDQVTGRRIVEWDFSDRALQDGGPHIRNRYTIAGVVEDFRFTPYDRHAYSILTPRSALVNLTPKVLIRLKPEADTEAFVSHLQAENHPSPSGRSGGGQALLRAGNHILVRIMTYTDYIDRKDSTGDPGVIRTLLGILLAVFLLNVVLGTLGTYWLQIRKRTEDIGIMRSFGAKRRDIFFMIWQEAALLTLLACILGQIIWLQFAINIELSDGLSQTYASTAAKDWVNTFWLHYLIICVVQYLLLLTVVSLGILVPAWRACRKHPVEALHHE